jgi:hypothetical protein
MNVFIPWLFFIVFILTLSKPSKPKNFKIKFKKSKKDVTN